MQYEQFLNHEVFKILSELSKELKINAYVVGGYVRDCFLDIDNKDIDIVVEGSGIEFSAAFAKKVGEKHHFYENYGTAMVRYKGIEVEFVGARKEMYERGSRNPIVEDGTLLDDLLRRDFTVNAMALSLNDDFGALVDPFDGKTDLEKRIIRTPGDIPNITFSDDPLRIYRGIRFVAKLSKESDLFKIDDNTWEGMKNNTSRIHILTQERITEEIDKILSYDNSALGLELINLLGIWDITFEYDGRTMVKIGMVAKIDEVLDKYEDKKSLKWAVLLGKGAFTLEKLKDRVQGMRLPNSTYNFIEKVVTNRTVFTDKQPLSVFRKFVAENGLAIYDIYNYWFCHELYYADETNVPLIFEKYKRIRFLFSSLTQFIGFKLPLNGNIISEYIGVPPGPQLGLILNNIKEGIFDGRIENTVDGVYWWLFNTFKN